MAKQTEIPGTERKTIAAIDSVATNYLQLRDQWMGLQGEVESAQVDLNDALKKHKKHKLEHYVFVDDEGVQREVYYTEPRVKVRKLKAAGGGGDE